MKRLALLILVAVLSFSMLAFSAPAPLPGPAAANQRCHNVRLVRICASVSESVVSPGSYVTIYGSIKEKGVGVAGQTMRVVWSSKTTETCSAVTDSTGAASCTTYVPSYVPNGRTVNVKVWMGKYKINTNFRIKVRDTSSSRTEE